MHSVLAPEVLDQYLCFTRFIPTMQKLVTGRCSTTLNMFSSAYQDHKLSSDLIHTFCDVQMVYNNLLILVYRLQL